MPSFRLTLAYDGTDFAGSQIQPNARTVQGELERALASIVQTPVRSVFAGRTDRGVHAAGQVVAIHVDAWRAGAADLERALTVALPRDVAPSALAPCDSAFNPRFDARWREYRYWIAPGEVSPFLRRYSWTPRAAVAADAVARGGQLLVGTHDFASFAGGGEGVPWAERARRPRGTTRTVLRCECREVTVSDWPGAVPAVSALEIRVAADGFLPRMVRNIVGALVEVGQYRREPAWIGDVLAARDRRMGSVVAPAHGLTLWRIGFDGEEPAAWAR
jgi:tRNA pseudouridine38-40 synthase